jgi:hypothetical protein
MSTPTALDHYILLEAKSSSNYNAYDELDDTRKKFIDFYAKRAGITPDEWFSNHANYDELTSSITSITVGVPRKNPVQGDPKYEGATEAPVYIFDVLTLLGDENKMLQVLAAALSSTKPTNGEVPNSQRWLAGHGIRIFDTKFIAHRMYKYGIPIPNQFNTFGKKPWEVKIVDTLDEWKIADPGGRVSSKAKMLLETFGVVTPLNVEQQKTVEDAKSRQAWDEIDQIGLREVTDSLYLLQTILQNRDDVHVLTNHKPYKVY